MPPNLTPQHASDLTHWSAYGQPGRAPAKRVTAADWKTSPFHDPITSAWTVRLEPSQLAKLLDGFLPREMEDKWFVFADGPDPEGHVYMHFYRSWTGIKVAEVDIEIGDSSGGDGLHCAAHMTSVTWEASQEVTCGRQDERSAKRTVREVCRWVMGVELPDEGA
ncbi:hypothetical protein MMC27_003486 [Xylographa pallens]|nr:hypothetical protein [Xylographa pallens]